MRDVKFLAGDKEKMFDSIGSYQPLSGQNEGVEKSVTTDQPLAPSQDITPIREVRAPMLYSDWSREFGDMPDTDELITPESQPDEAMPDATVLPTELESPSVDIDKPVIDVSLDTPTMEQPLQLPESRPEEQPLPISNPELESPIVELDKPQIDVSLDAPVVEQPLELPESRPEEQPLPIINPELEVEAPELDKPELDTSLTRPEVETPSSADTYSLTFNNEIGRGKYESRKLHTPPGNSGVTIGPGYDLSHRKAEEVVKDLTSVGIPKGVAEKIAQGIGLKGEEAKKFAKDNSEIKITDEQEKALFDKVVPEYQRRAERDYNKLPIKGKPDYEKLPEEVKALLLDYSYNVGVTKFPKFFKALVSGDKEEAIKQYKRYAGKDELDKRNKDTLSFLKNYDFKDLSEGE